jgi:hypothetical protein
MGPNIPTLLKRIRPRIVTCIIGRKIRNIESSRDIILTGNDANQGAGHVDHTRGNGAEVAQDPLSLPSSPITKT